MQNTNQVALLLSDISQGCIIQSTDHEAVVISSCQYFFHRYIIYLQYLCLTNNFVLTSNDIVIADMSYDMY